jgi:hypothetical protein
VVNGTMMDLVRCTSLSMSPLRTPQPNMYPSRLVTSSGAESGFNPIMLQNKLLDVAYGPGNQQNTINNTT